MAFLIQLAVSAVAVAALVALAAWAKIARDAPPLDEAHARRLFDEDFADVEVAEVWVADDGQAAFGHAGERTLVAWKWADNYIACSLPSEVIAAANRSRQGEKVEVLLDDPGKRWLKLKVREPTWPPSLWHANASA